MSHTTNINPNPSHIACRYLQGTSTKFDLIEFKSLPTEFNLREQYLNTVGKQFPPGASRAVWDIGGKRVLKLSMDNGEVNQNPIEVSVWNCSGRNKTVLAEIYDYSQDGSWLIMEKLGKITPSTFAKMVNNTLGWTGLLFESGEVFRDITELLGPRGYRNFSKVNQWRYDRLKSEPNLWWDALRDLVSTCHLKHNDLWIRNWGHRAGVPVLLDYGLTE